MSQKRFRGGLAGGLLILLLGALSPSSLESRAESASPRETGVLLSIRGSINPGTADYLQHGLREATARQAGFVVLELDTPGGLVSSVRTMAQTIEDSAVPVVVYVHPAGAAATSAGALLMLASHVGAMAPGSTMGAAHPVGPGGAEIPGASGQKATQDVASFARGLAEVRGRNRVAAEAIVERSQSFTAQEALGAGLVEIIAEDSKELLRGLQGRRVQVKGPQGKSLEWVFPKDLSSAVLQRVPMTTGQKILSTLAHPDVATLLMSIGGLLVYVELQTPGVGIAGGLGAVCLLTGLTAYQLIPIRTTGLLLLCLGLVLFIAEIFVTSHGALAISGLVAFALGALWLVDPAWSSQPVSLSVWLPLALGMGVVALAVVWATARLARQVEKARAQIGGGGNDGLHGYQGVVQRVSLVDAGCQGEILIRGELWNFSCRSSLSVGDSVRVISVRGLQVEVKPDSR